MDFNFVNNFDNFYMLRRKTVSINFEKMKMSKFGSIWAKF